MTVRLHVFHQLPSVAKVAFVVWVLLIFGVVARVAFSKPTSQSVLRIYLNGSQRWVDGVNIYVSQPPLDLYRNPPAFAAAFVPFTLLPEKIAGIAWRLVSTTVFLFGLATWTQYGWHRSLSASETGWLYLLASPLALPSLNNGQTNLIVIGFLLLGATAAAQSRMRSSAMWLSLAAGVKVYPLAVGLLIGLVAPRRFYPWLVAGCVAGAAVPFLFQNSSFVLDMYHSLAQSTGADDRTFADPSRAPKDVFLVLRVWCVAPSPMLYLAGKLALAGGMAALVWCTVRRTANPRIVVPLALHLGCIWITAFGPATEVHTYTLLAPTAAAIVLETFRCTHERGRLVLAVLGYLLVISPVVRDMFPNGAAFHALGPQPVGGLLLLIALTWSVVLRHSDLIQGAKIAKGASISLVHQFSSRMRNTNIRRDMHLK